ncbi:MAG TPA: DUF2922 domain-containing protein [Atribacteraceae bacterium]|nr:DUF2922 domain-containing protein [Atribacteraceae bacterium]
MPDLIMTFLNQAGGQVNLTLRDADPAVTGAQVGGFMDTVITRNVFASAGGDLTEKYEAKLVEVTETPLTVTG